MCGIAGIWGDRSNEGHPAQVDSMLKAMLHRGPDGNGRLKFEGGAAGMVRLALVDLSDKGQQPIWSPDRRVAIIFNGEMYNFREERQRLVSQGYSFQSATDTEVILALYLERGLDFVQRLRGMFALALFDWRETLQGNSPIMVLARDPFGIKPLYIAQTHKGDGAVVFASEIRALLASGCVPREVDAAGLKDYLTYGFVIQPRTMIAGVRMLEPGTLERYQPGAPVERKYFWHMPESEPLEESLDEAAERLRSIIDESVALHAMADAPIGAFLSGGIDSTGIVGLMHQHIPHLKTYTLRFPGLPGSDEATEAVATSEAFGCENSVIEVTGSTVKSALPIFAASLDQPSTDGLNTWLISRAAAQDVKGVLSGLGGDEWFAGYPVTRRMARYDSMPLGRAQAVAGHLAYAVSRRMPQGRLHQRVESLASRRNMLATWIQTHTVFTDHQASKLTGITDGEQVVRFEGLLGGVRDEWAEESPVGISCLLDATVYMRSQLLRDSDATSMAHSLELRVPFVDAKIAAFSRTCADNFKLRPDGSDGLHYQESGSKRVLIQALRDILPSGVANRPKRGFALPFAHWMKRELSSLVEKTCHPEVVRRRGLINPKIVSTLYKDREFDLPGNLYPKLWSLMILELWCRAVLDV